MQGRSTRGTAPAQAPSGVPAALTIVDAHQHFWDPVAATTTRGSATSRRSRSATATTGRSGARYLPPDYRADAAPFAGREDGLRRGRMGSAPIRSARCATSTACAASTACRRSRWRRPGSMPTTPQRCSSSRRRSRSCAASGTSRAPIARRPMRRRAAWPMRAGAAATRELARHGLRFDLQTPWWHLAEAARLATDFPGHADHPQSHRAAGRSQRRGHRRLEARDGDARGLPERGGEDLRPRPAGPAVDRRRQPRHRAHGDRTLRRRRAACSRATSRSTACARASRTIFGGFREIVRDFSAAEQRALFHDNAIRIYGMDR